MDSYYAPCLPKKVCFVTLAAQMYDFDPEGPFVTHCKQTQFYIHEKKTCFRAVGSSYLNP